MRRICIIVLVTLVVSNVFAQRLLEKPKHFLGVKGGVTMSMMSFNPNISQTMKYSFVIGAMYRLVNEKYFGIQIEANYSQRGWKERDTKYQRTLGYLEIPFLSHITFGNNVCKGFVNLGPSVSLLLHENNILSSESLEHHSLAVDNIVDYSIMGGLGFEFHSKAGVWNLEGRYSFGLGDIFNSRAKDIFRASNNQNIYVTLSWLFPIK